MAAAQLTLDLKDLRQNKRGTHGGRRLGAGRRNRSGLQGHGARPRLSTREPLHVTLRLSGGLPTLRRKDLFRCLREAVRTARQKGFGVVHFSILSNHIHLIMEAGAPGLAVTRPLQSLATSFAKRLNALLKRKGKVFADRYHVRALKTPTETRNAIQYVLANESIHRMRRGSTTAIEVRLDPFSSAWLFPHWERLAGGTPRFSDTTWSVQAVENWLDEILVPAKTWLLRTGWMRARPIS
jgi:putative transposase